MAAREEVNPGRAVKSEIIPPPYPWCRNRRATVQTLDDLLQNNITKIKGSFQCKKCSTECEMEYELLNGFNYIAQFIIRNKDAMYHRAPEIWVNPTLPTCPFCRGDNSMKPLIANKKRKINWLFLLLGQLIGCCTLEQIKYFCKHTGNHRTGAKDRVLYLAYLGICKQLQPDGPFDIAN